MCLLCYVLCSSRLARWIAERMDAAERLLIDPSQESEKYSSVSSCVVSVRDSN